MIFFPDVQSYLKFCDNPNLSRLRPDSCRNCGMEHPLSSHGQYKRNVWYGNGQYRIPVFRFKCESCGKTIGALPSFVGRYQRCSWDMQEDVLLTHEDGATLEQAGDLVPTPSGPISFRTVWRWKKDWKIRMELAEPTFWSCMVSAKPTLQWSQGTRPQSPIKFWRWVWHQASPMELAVGLFHGLIRLHQLSGCFAV